MPVGSESISPGTTLASQTLVGALTIQATGISPVGSPAFQVLGPLPQYSDENVVAWFTNGFANQVAVKILSTSSNTTKAGLAIEAVGAGDALFIGLNSGSNFGLDILTGAGALGPLLVLNNASQNVRLAAFTDGATTSDGIDWTTHTKTTGALLAFKHDTSAFSGSLIYANVAVGSGTFSGSFLSFNRNGAPICVLGPNGLFTVAASVALVGFGFAGILGQDNRLAVAGVDGSPITLWTPAYSGQMFRLMGRVFGASGTVTGATYLLKWTEGGAVITKTLSITAVDTDADLSILIQPDANHSITAQLTALTGSSPTVNVAAQVEECY
jgi:hypothetical protein